MQCKLVLSKVICGEWVTLLSKHYKFKLDSEYSYKHRYFSGIQYINDWFSIENGVLCVKSEYVWDGCTPKFHIMGLFSIGTPDGALRHGVPWTYYASLVHDVLCQFRYEIPLSQRQVTQIFKEQLEESKWPLTKLYVMAVTKFGPKDFNKDNY